MITNVIPTLYRMRKHASRFIGSASFEQKLCPPQDKKIMDKKMIALRAATFLVCTSLLAACGNPAREVGDNIDELPLLAISGNGLSVENQIVEGESTVITDADLITNGDDIDFQLEPRENSPVGTDAYDIFDVRNPIPSIPPASAQGGGEIDTAVVIDGNFDGRNQDYLNSGDGGYIQEQVTGAGVGANDVLFAPASVADTGLVTRPYNHVPGVALLNVSDSFTFSNPTVNYTVRSITGDSMFWESDNGDRSVSTHNLLLPAVSWVSEQRGQGSREILDIQGSLFPLSVGHTMSFRVVSTSNVSPYRWESRWTCSVVNRGIINVVAGEFDTYVVTCSRDQDEEITFYFAPVLGHYVRQEVTSRGDSDVYVRELIAYNRPSLGFNASRLPQQGGDASLQGVSASAQSNFRSTYTPSLPLFNQDQDVNDPLVLISDLETSTNNTTKTNRSVAITTPVGDYDARGIEPYRIGTGYYTHLASYFNVADAERGWNIITGEVAQLEKEPKSISKVNIPGRGEFYRLLVGPYVTLSAANAVCRSVKQDSSYCQVLNIK